MNKETESTDYNYEGFVIRIKKSTFQNSYCYLIYLINESGKWKRIRGMEGYSNNKEALLKAQNYLDLYKDRHLKSVEEKK